MKKQFLFAAVAALMTCACSVEPIDSVLPEEDGEITVLTAGFAGDETRTVRQADGKVFWSPKDEISIVRGSSNRKFTASNTEPAAAATFSGTMPSGTGNYWAVYPYSADNNIQNSYLVTTLPAQQEAVAGSFADDLFISAAYEKNTTKELTFHHQCGGVKFSVTQPGVKRATLMPADGSVFLAGLIGLYASSAGQTPYIRATGYEEDMSHIVELSAPAGETLIPGEAYHFVTMPATLKGGFSLFLEKEDGSYAVRTISRDVTISAGHFATLLEADKGVDYGEPYLNYSPDAVTIDGQGGVFGIYVEGTMDYHIDVASDWIHAVESPGDARFGRTHGFLADKNTEGKERTGILTICYGENCYPIMVTQGALSDATVYAHHSLGMRFTATWCGYCPIMSETFRLAKENLGDKFEYVCLYGDGGNYYFSDMSYLESQYAIGGYPTGIVDGRRLIENYSSSYAAGLIADAVSETETYFPAATGIALESSVSGRNLTVKADVTARLADSYKITVLLLEDGIIGYQADYNAGAHQDFEHNRVARMTLSSSITGQEFEIAAAGETKSFTYTATIPSDYNLDNLLILAWVQRPFGDLPAIQSGNYGGWYVDNCRSAALGATAPLEVQ